MKAREERQIRTVSFDYKQEGDERIIEGYFIRFNEPTELFPGIFEQILPEAVSPDINSEDIRALWNHNTQYVLGRTTAGSLSIRVDNSGVWAHIELPDTSYANDVHALVKRGDVNQCSFGFDILDEEMVELEDGNTRFDIKKIKLYEVSVVTFPAYPTTSVSAREYKKAKLERKKADLLKKLKEGR